MKYALSIALSVVAMLSRAWSASLIWGWFIAGPFALPKIGIFTAIGISSLVFVLTFDPTVKREKPEDAGIANYLGIIIASLIAAGLGWVVLWVAGGRL